MGEPWLNRQHSALAWEMEMNEAMTHEGKMSAAVLLWCFLIALALLIFFTQEPL